MVDIHPMRGSGQSLLLSWLSFWCDWIFEKVSASCAMMLNVVILRDGFILQSRLGGSRLRVVNKCHDIFPGFRQESKWERSVPRLNFLSRRAGTARMYAREKFWREASLKKDADDRTMKRERETTREAKQTTVGCDEACCVSLSVRVDTRETLSSGTAAGSF